MLKRPGGELATRPLHFIWLCDSSGSMAINGKIQALNTAIREAIPHMQKVADENPNAEVLIRAIRFSDGASWHVSQPTPVADFKWMDLSADGITDMGRALTLAAEQIRQLPGRGLPPVLVLISDGQPTDNFSEGLHELLSHPWGKKAVRIAIAIGEDADLDTLQEFIANPEIKPLQANNPEALVRYIKWVSTAVLQSASAPASQAAPEASSSSETAAAAVDAVPPAPLANVPIPAPPAADSVDGEEGDVSPEDVW